MFGKIKLKAMSAEQAYAQAKLKEKEGEKKSLPYYLHAAEMGHIGAQYRMGEHYRLGIKDKKDPKLALYWFEEAAMQGNEDALDNMRILKSSGRV